MPVAIDTAHKKVVVAAVDTVASSSSSFVVAVAVVKGVPVARLPVQVAAVVAVVSFALPLRMERFDRTGSVSSLSLFSIPSELFCPSPLLFSPILLFSFAFSRYSFSDSSSPRPHLESRHHLYWYRVNSNPPVRGR